MGDQDAGLCKVSNSGKHQWKTKRITFKNNQRFWFRVCKACGLDDLQIDPAPKRRHRKG